MRDLDSYKSYLFDAVTKLLNTPSPTGYYKEVMPLLKTMAEEVGAKFELTNKGCAVLTVEGKNGGYLGACAHTDTLGAMVRSIDSKGGLCFTVLGGPQLPTLDGEYCTVITRDGKKFTGTILCKSPSSHVYPDAKSRPRDDANMYVRLDEVVKNADDVKKLGINSGDYICIDTKTVVTPSGYLKSRFIDDKASVACILTAFKYIKDNKIELKHGFKALITMYEEVGHGAAFVPDGLIKMLAVDMGCIGLDLNCTEHDVSICAKDGGGPYDYDFTNQLIDHAKRLNLKYAVDVYPFYGSDVGAMWRGGNDIVGALVGTGVHASHGMERTHYDGLKNTTALILAYLGVL